MMLKNLTNLCTKAVITGAFAIGLLLSGAEQPVYAQAQAEQQESIDVKTGLKEAGISTLPTFLDAATESITIKFPKALGGGKLKFGGTIDAEALQEKRFVFVTSEEGRIKWDNAFGLSFLDLKDVMLNLTISKGDYAISLDGTLGGAFGKDKQVIIDIATTGKELTDFTFSAPESTLSLSSIPELKKLPGVKTFKISKPTVSKNSVRGEITFQKQVVDSVLFKNEQDVWTMAFRLDKPLRLGELIGQKKGLLKQIALPRATLFSSTAGLEGKVEDLPLALQQFLEEGQFAEDELSLAEGVTLETVFNPGSMPSDIKSALKTIGMTQKINLTGNIGGVFGGPKSVMLKAPIETSGSKGFPFLKRLPNTSSNFFIDMSEQHSGVGIASAVQLKGGKNPMYFDVDFEYRTTDTGMALMAAGAMRGDWKNAAGIKGFTLRNPFMSVGIKETGGFDLLMDGTYLVGKREVRVAADVVLQSGAGFAPEAMAFAGTLDKLPISNLMAQAAKLVKLDSGSLKKAKVDFRELEFAFMTPGAQLPEDLQEKFQIDGAGMALNGALWVQGNDLGSLKGYASTKGVLFDTEVSPFKVGPLSLKDARLLLEAGPSVDPKFMFSGETSLFKGYKEKYLLSLGKDNMEFQSETKFGGLFDASMIAKSNGLSFSPSNDFAFEATLAAPYTKAFMALVNASLKGLEKSAEDIKQAKEDVGSLEAKVKKLNDKITVAKAQAKKDKEKATRSIKSAESKVSKLRDEIKELNKKVHDKKKSVKKAAKKLKGKKLKNKLKDLVKLEAKLKSVQAAKKSADWALKAAKKTVQSVPAVSPQVIKLESEKAIELAALKSAEGVLKGLLATNKGIQSALKAASSSSFQIIRLGAAGSLKGITTAGKSGERPVLIVETKIAGKSHTYRQPISPDQKDFNKLASGIANLAAKQLVSAIK